MPTRSLGTLCSCVISVTILIVAIYIRHSQPLEGPCLNDPAIQWDQMLIDPCHCFSETYQEARAKFRSKAQQVGAQLHSLVILDDYTMDIAILPGTLPGLVVHTSGVHGIEGFAGSAIQLAWLVVMDTTRSDDRPTVILVHAINPFGMAHDRRFNEKNVDLNRNALTPDEWKVVQRRDSNLVHYEDFSTAFNPTTADLPYHWFIWPRLLFLILRHGFRKLKVAMVTGQYHNEQGIFYGGTTLQPSISKLYAFMKDWLEKNQTVNQGLVTWMDVHTGLGVSGEDTILLHGNTPAMESSEVFHGSHIPGVHKEGDSVLDGYNLTIGSCQLYFQGLFNESAWLLTQEFGTKHAVMVGRALILENMLYHQQQKQQKDIHPTRTRIMRSAFYVQTQEWRKAILSRGLRVLTQAIGRSSI